MIVVSTFSVPLKALDDISGPYSIAMEQTWKVSYWAFLDFQENRDRDEQHKLDGRQQEIEKWRNQISELHYQVLMPENLMFSVHI